MRENEQSLVIKNEKLQSDLKRMEIVITNGGKQLELVNTQKEELIREIKDLKEHLGTTRNSDHNSKTSTIKLQEKLNSSEILIQDLKTTLQAETQKIKALMQ
jgi:archaellum component FlaC